MAKLLFNKGTYSALQTKIANGDTFTDGALYLTTDEGGLYLGNGTKNLTRIQGSVLYFDSLEAFTNETKPPYSTNVIYFIADSNALVRWNGENWIQLNETADDVKAIVEDLKTSIKANTDNIKTNADNITALNTSLTSLTTEVGTKASAEELAAETSRATQAETALGNRVTALESADDEIEKSIQTNADAIGVLKTSVEANTSAITKEISDRQTAITELDNKKVDQSTYSAKVKTLETNISTAQTAADGAQGAADNAAAAAASAQSAADKAQASANTAQTAADNEAIRAQEAEAALKTSIEGEATRAKGVEATLQSGIDGKLSKGGDTMSGALAMGNNKITGLATPTANTDAANKQYVDNAIAQVNSDASALTERVEAVESQASTNATKIAANTTRIDGLDTTVAGQGTRLTTAEGNISTLQTNLKSKVDTTTYNTDKSTLEASIAAAQSAANTAQTGVDNLNKSVSDLEANSATKTELTNTKNTLLGSSTDTADKDTIYGAKKAAAAAQTTANTANATANTNKTSIENLQKTVDSLSANTSSNFLKLDGTNKMAGNLDMNKHSIKNVVDPTEAQDAATKAYVDNAMQTADAMTFKGVVGVDPLVLPTGAVNKGDTYKVGKAGTYAGNVAKVGDLIIYNGDDTETAVAASWVHVSSGYEDDYLQKLKYDSTNNLFYLTDGVHTENSNNQGSFKIVSGNDNLKISISSDGVITADLVWGTF